jgi:hypothetical protein
MVAINGSVVLLSAVVAATLVVAFETSGSRAESASAAAQVAQRFPLASEMFTPVPITKFVAPKFIAAQKAAAAQKSHRPSASQFCATTPHGWPYVSHECRVAAGGMTFTQS